MKSLQGVALEGAFQLSKANQANAAQGSQRLTGMHLEANGYYQAAVAACLNLCPLQLMQSAGNKASKASEHG